MRVGGVNQAADLPEIARRRLGNSIAGGEHPDAGLLTAFVEGTLSKAHRNSVLDHLATCSDCNQLMVLILPEREAPGAAQPVAKLGGWFSWTRVRWAGVSAVAAALICAALIVGRMGTRVLEPSSASLPMEKAPFSRPTGRAPVLVDPGASPSRMEANQQPRGSLPHASVGATPPAKAAIAAQSRPAVPGEVSGPSAYQTSIIARTTRSLPRSESARIEQPAVKVDTPPAAMVNPAAVHTPIGTIWAVSDAGALQTSTDGGHTWTSVALPSGAPLHAISVLGQDIWTGGDQGTLYHSTDAGRTWSAVVPAANGAVLLSSIARIAFSDVRHGWIATAEGEIWTTHDGGVTWSRN